MDLLEPSGVGMKKLGDSLSHQDFNAVNNTVNSGVNHINEVIKDFCNINSEANDFSRKFSLNSAVLLVPSSRRRLGMKIRFLGSEGNFLEFIYKGTDTNEENWTNEDNWAAPFDIIDGGEW